MASQVQLPSCFPLPVMKCKWPNQGTWAKPTAVGQKPKVAVVFVAEIDIGEGERDQGEREIPPASVNKREILQTQNEWVFKNTGQTMT